MASNQGLGRHMRPRYAWLLWHVRTFNRLKSIILLWFETGLERFIPLYPWPCPSNYIPVALSLKTSTDEQGAAIAFALFRYIFSLTWDVFETTLVPVYILQANQPTTWIQNHSSGSFGTQTMFASTWILPLCPVNIAVCLFSMHYGTPSACSMKDYTLSEGSAMFRQCFVFLKLLAWPEFTEFITNCPNCQILAPRDLPNMLEPWIRGHQFLGRQEDSEETCSETCSGVAIQSCIDVGRF